MLATTTIFAEASVTVPQTIQIDTVQGIIAIVIFLVTAGIAWGTLRTSVKNIKEDVGSLKSDMKDIRERFAGLEGKSSGLYQSNSPISLTPAGDKALNESGLKDYIDENQDDLISECDEEGKLPTSYDVQECVFEFMDSYDFPTDVEEKLKTYAFDNGLTLDMVRRVGAIYLRDIILDLKGFKAEDIDANSASKK